jgi:PHD/YefM family antitoxin component YafN of YafNO toxin-antitoxin module
MKTIDVLDLDDGARALVSECEITGTQTLFTRNDRPVAILASYDEYLALRETIDIMNEPLLYARIETAEEEGRTGKVLLVEDLFDVE